MGHSFVTKILVGTSLFLSTGSLYAAPEISVDSANYDMGIVREGAQKSIKHSFKIKNTGNENLVISRVKPGCGCTAVGHDSLILPGKEGSVTAEINLSNFRSGGLRKYLTVYSNAKKTPEMTLSLGCTIRSDLSIEPSYIRIVTNNSGSFNQTLTVTSNKKDLQILEVNFKENSNPDKASPAWQNDLPIIFVHKFARKDTVLSDGFSQFKLDISLKLKEMSPMYGNFNFKTNYPGKETVTLSGSLETEN